MIFIKSFWIILIRNLQVKQKLIPGIARLILL
jgi:hypothetical protein